MKKIIIIFISTFFTGGAFAQIPDEAPSERIESLKIAFLAEKLELTPEESQAFWPLYNERQTKMKTLRPERARKHEVKNMTDAEAEAFMLKNFEMEEQRIALKREYFQKMKSVIPVRKIARIQQAERQFKKRLLDRVKRRRRGMNQRF